MVHLSNIRHCVLNTFRHHMQGKMYNHRQQMRPKIYVNAVQGLGTQSMINKRNQVVTIPNILTFSRICVSPAIGYFIMTGQNTNALACFAFAATTDMLDGYIARRFKMDSDVGQILDPIADKLLASTSLIALCQMDIMPFWLVKGIIYREVILLTGGAIIRYFGFPDKPGFKKFFDFKNHPTRGFEPTFASKCNTALLCAVIATHLGTHHLAGIPLYDWSMFSVHCLTAVLTSYTLWQYVWRVGRMNLDRPKY